MRHGSLFSGIGGFDLAAQWMGWQNVFQVEKELFCQKVLEKNFPQVKRYGDIKQFNGTKYRGAVDVISGGFPCQPASTAGKRAGTKDVRWLFPQADRIIGEVAPCLVVLENVPGLISLEDGMAFESVLSSLENRGYETWPFIIPACGVDAPHKRDRVWIVAYSKAHNDRRIKREIHQANGGQIGGLLSTSFGTGAGLCGEGSTTIAACQGFSEGRIRGRYEAQLAESTNNYRKYNWNSFPTESPICGGDDGIPDRVDRVKALGNAIVPQVAYEIFKAIEMTL